MPSRLLTGIKRASGAVHRAVNRLDYRLTSDVEYRKALISVMAKNPHQSNARTLRQALMDRNALVRGDAFRGLEKINTVVAFAGVLDAMDVRESTYEPRFWQLHNEWNAHTITQKVKQDAIIALTHLLGLNALQPSTDARVNAVARMAMRLSRPGTPWHEQPAHAVHPFLAAAWQTPQHADAQHHTVDAAWNSLHRNVHGHVDERAEVVRAVARTALHPRRFKIILHHASRKLYLAQLHATHAKLKTA